MNNRLGFYFLFFEFIFEFLFSIFEYSQEVITVTNVTKYNKSIIHVIVTITQLCNIEKVVEGSEIDNVI